MGRFRTFPADRGRYPSVGKTGQWRGGRILEVRHEIVLETTTGQLYDLRNKAETSRLIRLRDLD